MSRTGIAIARSTTIRPPVRLVPVPTSQDKAGQSLLDELLLAFEHAPVGLCVLRHGTIQRCNRAFAAMFGYEVAELCGSPLTRLDRPPAERNPGEDGERGGLPALRGDGSCSDDRVLVHREGHPFWCHVAGRALDPVDPLACSVWMFEDLSAQRPITAALTPRERDIARELVTGKTSKQIARHLAISHRTVEAHRARLMRKLDAATPGEMIARLAGAA